MRGRRKSGHETMKGPAMSEAGWSLHPQLEHDTEPVGDLGLSRVVAIHDADYPWLILVPRRAGVTEIADLGADDAAESTAEMLRYRAC